MDDQPSGPSRSGGGPGLSVVPTAGLEQAPPAGLATELAPSGTEEAFDRLTRLAAVLLDAPLAFVTVVDTTRSWYQACVGLAPDAEQFAAVEESLCRQVVRSRAPLVVGDVRADRCTSQTPAIARMRIAAWAGFPIHALGGEVVGTFCVVDAVPRQWSSRDVLVIETLAAAASGEIALRAALAAEALAHALAEQRVVEASELARMVGELGERSEVLARTLRRSLLPPVLPEAPGLEVAARYQPARGEEVVGDFYDVFKGARSSWCVVMGDVCGKGPEAATVTALAHYTLRAAAARSISPARVLGLLNTALLDQRPDNERFVTVALASLRVARGRVLATVASAGHPLPLLRRNDGTVEAACKPGMALGMFDKPPLLESKLAIEPGESLVFYTDGVTEARRGPDELGVDGLRQLIAGIAPGSSAAHMAASIEAHVGDYRDGPPRDDTAILVVQVPKSQQPGTPKGRPAKPTP